MALLEPDLFTEEFQLSPPGKEEACAALRARVCGRLINVSMAPQGEAARRRVRDAVGHAQARITKLEEALRGRADLSLATVLCDLVEDERALAVFRSDHKWKAERQRAVKDARFYREWASRLENVGLLTVAEGVERISRNLERVQGDGLLGRSRAMSRVPVSVTGLRHYGSFKTRNTGRATSEYRNQLWAKAVELVRAESLSARARNLAEWTGWLGGHATAGAIRRCVYRDRAERLNRH